MIDRCLSRAGKRTVGEAAYFPPDAPGAGRRPFLIRQDARSRSDGNWTIVQGRVSRADRTLDRGAVEARERREDSASGEGRGESFLTWCARCGRRPRSSPWVASGDH